MKRIQADDADALGELFERYARKAYGLARMLCRRPDIAEDVVQEAFISIWRSRSTYRPMDVDVSRWAMTIVRHRAVDAIRHHRSHERWHLEAELAHDHEAIDDLVGDAVSRDEARQLRDLLARLPGAQRDVIVLAYYGELTHGEIATHLDLALGTVKGRMRLGLARLREGM